MDAVVTELITELDPVTLEKLQVTAEQAVRDARVDFWAYRQYINPGMLRGWWQWEIAKQLQAFYGDLVAGKRPALILEAPPQHGKSIQVVDFVSWVAGKDPRLKTIYTSFSDDLGLAANSRLQRIFFGDQFRRVFPETKAGIEGAVCNSSFIEYAGYDGSFINTTVDGQLTGKGLNLGVIDDPLKGRAAAESETIRKKIWDWFTDDFFTRFAEHSGMVMMLTRWHLDDPAGRLQASNPNVRVLRYPAIAEEDEPDRLKGEPLFPELKSLDFLLERKSLMSQYAWLSEYQQNPVLSGGNMFKRHWFKIVGAPANDCYWVRRWDLAATEEGGSYTCGVLMGRSRAEGNFYVGDVVRARLEGEAVKKLIKQTSQLDQAKYGRHGYTVWVPQDPGQAGKVQVKDIANMLAGFDIRAERETGDKELRAQPFADQAEVGNVNLVNGEWIKAYLDEISLFPASRFKDQVDASSGAFGALILYPKQFIRVGAAKGAA